MPNYRRAQHPGGTYFFKINLLQRHHNDLLIRHIDRLRQSVRTVKRAHPFNIHGWLASPDYLYYSFSSVGNGGCLSDRLGGKCRCG